MRKSIIGTLVSISLAAAAAPAAIAQPANPSADAPRAHIEQRVQRDKRPFHLPGERVEARLAYLKTALKITDAQQPQWNAFADVLRKHAREMDKSILARRSSLAERTDFGRMNAIDRLQLRQERLAAAARRLNELLAVGKPLYAVLMPEQKQIADELLVPRHRGSFHRRGMFRGA